jgi:hypothetical protein
MAVLPTGIGPVTGYNIERSLRFNSADSAYLNRTFASASNRTTWTLSCWVKRSGLGTTQNILRAIDGVANFNFGFTASDTLIAESGATNLRTTSAVYRDVSAWYHVVIKFDSSNGTEANRCIIYVNGTSQTTASGSVSSGLQVAVNTANSHVIGQASATYSNFYLTEVNFIDGQALTPSSFGETDAATGVWKPKKYTGTYGTNGFFLKFADNSGTTSTTLGKDSSGNSNNWTPNNFSVTAGAGNDSLVDSPTLYGTDTGVGGSVRGNYCTWNPLAKSAAVLLSNGNLNGSSDASQTGGCSGTIAVTSGKWYWETTIITFDGASAHGILKLPATNYATSEAGSYKYLNGGDIRIGDGSNTTYGASYGAGDVVGVALDLDNGKVFFSKNGVFQNSGNPVSGTNPAFSSLSGTFTAWCQDGSFTQVDTWATNFGQRPFAYTAPSGFKALCTTNLPTPTIGATSTTQANDYFDATVYTGTGSALTVTNSGMQPDWVWIKNRTSAGSSGLWDAIRGVNQRLISNLTNAEDTNSGVSAFNSNGFSVGTAANYNTNGNSFIAWQWRASNAAGVTNTAGTITSTVSANTTSGFSIVTYTGNATSGATVGHGLGATPAMIIVKNRSTGTNWPVYHANLTSAAYLLTLNTTNAQATDSAAWNNTAPTSTLFTLGSSTGTNGSTNNLVAYCFAPVAGYSAFGSYTGNGSTDGPFVFTNFRPRFVMFKRTDASGNSWILLDTSRNTYNAVDAFLSADLSNAESTSYPVDFLSNGFKIRATTSNLNTNGGTYIYMALAESPFKFSLAR